MAHLTNKKRREREKNNLTRSLAYTCTKAGTWDMGYESNNARKAAAHKESWKGEY